MLGNTFIAVAALLRGTTQRTASSEYFRARGPDAVADVFPYLLSKVKSLIVCKSLILY